MSENIIVLAVCGKCWWNGNSTNLAHQHNTVTGHPVKVVITRIVVMPRKKLLKRSRRR